MSEVADIVIYIKTPLWGFLYPNKGVWSLVGLRTTIFLLLSNDQIFPRVVLSLPVCSNTVCFLWP